MKALVVDDDANNRRVLELILESRGIDSNSAQNGVEAVQAFEEERFDLVFMDLAMPVMNGFDAIRRIRAVEDLRGGGRTPVVVVSAYTRTGDVQASASAGADRHMSKPLDVPGLLGAISDLTGAG